MKPLALPLVIVLFGTSINGQQAEKHYVRASADAMVTATPDQARISIGVQTRASTAKAAAEHNATQTSAVLKVMKDALQGKGQIRTSGYSLSPHFENSGNNPREEGFDASNTVEVTVDELTLLPQVIDAATGTGANSVGGISFGLKDDSAVRLQALGEASKQAKAAGEAMAQALNLHVTGIASVESGGSGGPVRPMMMESMMRSKMVSTPIESGTLEIRASVTVTLEVSP